MKKMLFFIFFGFSLAITAQRKYRKQLSLITDNDLYTSTIRDGYYTSGIFLNYEYYSNFSSKKTAKRTYQIALGQQMYSPYKSTVESIREHDRPFAGYLYAGFGYSNFYKNGNIFKLSGQIGTIGPSALGEETMEFIHQLYDFRKAKGWKYQIANAFALNFNASYIKYLGGDTSKTFDISWYNSAKLGSVFTDISTGIYGRIGLQPLTDLVNSLAFGGNFNGKNSSFKNASEFFLFIKPTLSYVFYDATIEGSFFNNKSFITYAIEPFKFTTEVGFLFTANRFNFGYTAIFHTKKLKSNLKKTSFYYGSIKLNYQFN